jgi:hypothetical protein
LLPLFSADVRAVEEREEESDSRIVEVEGGIAALGWRWALGIGGIGGGLTACSEEVVAELVVVDIGLAVPVGGWTVDLRLLLSISRC